MKTQAIDNHYPDIFEQAQAGVDPDVLLDEIVERFGSDLKNFARYRAGNEADAADAYQDALVAALRYIKSFRGETPIKHWLLKLVTTATLQKKRGRKNDPKLHIAIDPAVHPELDRQLVSREPPPDATAITVEAWEHLQEAFDSIGENERVMLMRHHGEDVPLKEIARDFKMTVPGVKTRLFRARAAIKKYAEKKQGGVA